MGEFRGIRQRLPGRRPPARGMIRFCHGADSATGQVRRVNEDSYLALPPLYAVADGMGGHGAGDRASALAVEALAARARVRPLSVEAVLAALDEANQAILRDGEADGMGTTITGLASLETVGGSHLMVFNVGDSRVYRMVGGRLDQVTVDHSEVQELVLAGALTRDQARTHPRRNIVTRALGSARPSVRTTGCCPPSPATDTCCAPTGCSTSCPTIGSSRCSPPATPAGGCRAGRCGRRHGRP